MKVFAIALVALTASCLPAFAFEMLGNIAISVLMAVPGGTALLPAVSAAVIGNLILKRFKK